MRRRLLAASLLTVALAGTACGSSTKSTGKSSAGLNESASTIPIVGGGGASTSAAYAGSASTAAAAAGAATTVGGQAAADSRAYPSTTAAASGTARTTIPAVPSPYSPPATYPVPEPGAIRTADDNRSTFALDVDTASYTLARNYLDNGVLPDPSSVRTEEFVNFFAAGFPEATERGLTLRADGARAPFLPANHRVLRVGVQGQTVPAGDRKPANLTFVIDTSGSMGEGNKLELVKSGLRRLVRSLGEQDTVEIVRVLLGRPRRARSHTRHRRGRAAHRPHHRRAGARGLHQRAGRPRARATCGHAPRSSAAPSTGWCSPPTASPTPVPRRPTPSSRR